MTSKSTYKPHKKPTFSFMSVDKHVYKMYNRNINIIHRFSAEATMSSLVYVHNPNGTTYVYENISYWDKEAKKSKQKRKPIGHLDPSSGKVVPNRKKGDAARARSGSSSNDDPRCTVLTCGVTRLLDKAVNDIGLQKVLASVFPNDWSRILTCAYYLVSEGGALCHVEKWKNSNVVPFTESLASQRISELLGRITPTLQQEFFGKWIVSNKQDEYYALDITSVSSYSDLIEFVRWGYNRDGDDLPQINLLMITGEKSHMPLYYRIIPGSIKDVRTLRESLKNMAYIEAGQLHYVMDKGFYSEQNIDAMYADHKRFMMGIPFTAGFATDLVERYRDTIRSHQNYCMVGSDDLYAVTELMDWGGHRFYAHVYYDSYKAAADEKEFDHTLHCCYEELISGNRVKEHKKYYVQFFFIKETPVRGIKVRFNEDAIAEYKRNHVGWFILAGNDIKDKVKALEVYRAKDAVEKCFDDLKNDLDMKRIRMHTKETMEGRIFIQFIALLITTRLKEVMNEAGWFKDYDLQEIIDEMKSMREVKVIGSRKKYATEPTPLQRNVIKLYGL